MPLNALSLEFLWTVSNTASTASGETTNLETIGTLGIDNFVLVTIPNKFWGHVMAANETMVGLRN